MPARLLSSRSFQISSAFLLLLLLFAGASLYSLGLFSALGPDGELSIRSNAIEGTRMHLLLPRLASNEQGKPDRIANP